MASPTAGTNGMLLTEQLAWGLEHRVQRVWAGDLWFLGMIPNISRLFSHQAWNRAPSTNGRLYFCDQLKYDQYLCGGDTAGTLGVQRASSYQSDEKNTIKVFLGFPESHKKGDNPPQSPSTYLPTGRRNNMYLLWVINVKTEYYI